MTSADFRGSSPTAPGGLPETQTARAVATTVAAGGVGEVATGLAPSADVPAAPAVFGGRLLPAVLLSVLVGAVCWRVAYGNAWDDAYTLGVEQGARAATLEAYRQGREHERRVCVGGGAS